MLTVDLVQASWSASESAVVGYLQPKPYTRTIVLMAVRGPTNSRLRIYAGYRQLDAHLRTNVFPADDRTYDSVTSAAPMTVPAGEAWTFAWTAGNSGAGQTAVVTVTSEVRDGMV